MVFDKIDINGDGEELPYAMPNIALTFLLPREFWKLDVPK